MPVVWTLSDFHFCYDPKSAGLTCPREPSNCVSMIIYTHALSRALMYVYAACKLEAHQHCLSGSNLSKKMATRVTQADCACIFLTTYYRIYCKFNYCTLYILKPTHAFLVASILDIPIIHIVGSRRLQHPLDNLGQNSNHRLT